MIPPLFLFHFRTHAIELVAFFLLSPRYLPRSPIYRREQHSLVWKLLGVASFRPTRFVPIAHRRAMARYHHHSLLVYIYIYILSTASVRFVRAVNGEQ